MAPHGTNYAFERSGYDSATRAWNFSACHKFLVTLGSVLRTDGMCVCVCVCTVRTAEFVNTTKLKVEVTLEQATMAQRGSRGIAVLFL